MCGADRSGSGVGLCGGGKNVRISLISKHYWEEPCISGTEGSGAVFFCGCPLRCVFCQNYKISRAEGGREYTFEELCRALDEHCRSGVHNLNLVTASHYTHQVAEALRIVKPKIPVVWNSGGYERVESLQELEGLVDIYLPDLKFCDSSVAKLYTAVPDYGEVSRKAVAEMKRQVGELELDENGIAVRGLLVRHLVLPSQTTQSRKILAFIASELGRGTKVSLMSQYIPSGEAALHPTINRRLTEAEYSRALEAMIAEGLDGYTQEPESADKKYIPDFR